MMLGQNGAKKDAKQRTSKNASEHKQSERTHGIGELIRD
jgi:hypothetical protein